MISTIETISSSGAEDDQRVPDAGQLERAADADQEQHGGQEHRDPDVVVADVARVVAGVELGGGRGVQRVALGLGRQLVLRHVGRAGRGVRVVQRVGGHPGVEGDPERGPEAPHRDPLLLLVVQGERDEPGVEGGRVEVAQLQGGDVVPGGEVAQGGGPRDLDPRRGPPPSRRVAGPGGGDRDQRQQYGLADLHDPGVPGFAPAGPDAPAVPAAAARLTGLSAVFGTLGGLAVLVQFLAGLDRVQSLGHG